jgi:hypothetical protein
MAAQGGPATNDAHRGKVLSHLEKKNTWGPGGLKLKFDPGYGGAEDVANSPKLT